MRIFFFFLVAATGFMTAPGIASAATSECKLVRIAEWPVQVTSNALIIDGAIDGQQVGVMLDTGAGSTLILRSAAARLGLRRTALSNYRQFGIADGSEVEIAYVDEFKVGHAVRHNWQMFVAGEYDLGGTVGVILGDDFLHKVDIEFDLAHNMVRLFQPKDCERASLAYWASAGTASVVPIEPLDEKRPQIIVTVQVNGRPIKALLDSGTETSVLDKWEAGKAGVTPDTPGVVAVTAPGKESPNSWIVPIQSFVIGDELIRDTALHITDLYKEATYTPPGSRVPKNVDEMQPMLLGADFLRAHRVLVSHSQKKMYFTYVGGPVFRTPSPQAAMTKASDPTAKAPRSFDDKP
jgi:predicted aspartyl protease